MQPPLSDGTVLQNRYRLVGILGQGGFGRTYLAEDQGRFNERCALKEFMPPANSYASDKGRELFRREASVLYQINHPQIPRFQATFEDEDRVFLVQDFVEGSTYRQLLTQRSQQGEVFTDSEVQHLLEQLLPVLSYLHGLGIVHRDIAPDNIILRERDRLPVLIDFGVVKELASRIYDSEATVVQATTVGKSGFSPSEQIQSGRAYPSSDLYALAATAVVLLTGREPQALFDDRELRWNWRPYAQVSPELATVLDTMLSHQPGQRYASANEALRALQEGGSADPMPPAGAAPVPQTPAGYPVPQTAPRSPVGQSPKSSMKTVAIGRAAPVTEAVDRSGGYRDDIPRAADDDKDARSLWDDPLAVVLTGSGLVLVTGFASWALVNWLLRPREETPVAEPAPTELASPTPTPTTTPSATPTPTPSATPEVFTQPLNLRVGIPLQDQGTLRENQVLTYRLYGEQGQELDDRLGDAPGVAATLTGPGGSPMSDGSINFRRWRGELPATGTYEIALRTIPGLDQANFTILTQLRARRPESTPLPSPDATVTPTPSVTPTPIPEPTPSPTPPPTPTPSPTPTAPPQNRSFQGVVKPTQSETRSLTVQPNQRVQVTFNSPAARLNAFGPDGSQIPTVTNRRDGTVSFLAPAAGTYEFEIKTEVETEFNLRIAVR